MIKISSEKLDYGANLFRVTAMTPKQLSPKQLSQLFTPVSHVYLADFEDLKPGSIAHPEHPLNSFHHSWYSKTTFSRLIFQ